MERMYVYELINHGNLLFSSLKSVYKYLIKKYKITQEFSLEDIIKEDNFKIEIHLDNKIFKVNKKMVYSSNKEDINLATSQVLLLT